MQQFPHVSTSRGQVKLPEPVLSKPVLTTAVGASYAFDPGADGLASIYAARILERGIDPRVLCAEVRADRLGLAERGVHRRTFMTRTRMTRFGRGTAAHLHSRAKADEPLRVRPSTSRRPAVCHDNLASSRRPGFQGSWSRKLAAAGLLVLLVLPLGVIAARAQDSLQQSRYVVQTGDTLDLVAAEFGVDTSAILAASAVQNSSWLTPGEIIIIPDSSESPDAAAWNASQRQGASPFVSGAHEVVPGESVATIAAAYGLDPWALAAFNGIANVDMLRASQRLRIPLTDVTVAPQDAVTAQLPPTEFDWATVDGVPMEEEQLAAELISKTDVDAVASSGPVFTPNVPAYQQMYSLSCEYAAAYIATSAFGWGIPESAFIERIGVSSNPHWGYRGNIHGAWGGTDDYGIYPEAMVPTLNEFGFVADVFYGADASGLRSRINAGMPVMTWLGYFGDTGWVQQDEGSYRLVPGLHVVTVYGYDDGGVYISNPGRGALDYYVWSDFLSMWSVLDGMALAVGPM